MLIYWTVETAAISFARTLFIDSAQGCTDTPFKIIYEDHQRRRPRVADKPNIMESIKRIRIQYLSLIDSSDTANLFDHNVRGSFVVGLKRGLYFDERRNDDLRCVRFPVLNDGNFLRGHGIVYSPIILQFNYKFYIDLKYRPRQLG